MSLRSAISMIFLVIEPVGFQLLEPIAWREVDLKSSINGICDLLKHSFLYNMWSEKKD
jgi:hypothetical protein